MGNSNDKTTIANTVKTSGEETPPDDGFALDDWQEQELEEGEAGRSGYYRYLRGQGIVFVPFGVDRLPKRR